MKIINRWSKYERWSMRDSDDVHYVTAEHDGKSYIFSEIDRPLSDEEVMKKIEYHVELAIPVTPFSEIKKFIDKWKRSHNLSDEEAAEVVNMVATEILK